MKRNTLLTLGIGLVILLAAYGVRYYLHSPTERTQTQVDVETMERLRHAEAERDSRSSAEALQSPEGRREAWEAIRSAIEEARHARVPAAEPSEAALAAEPATGEEPKPAEPDYGTLDESYIRGAMEEMNPLLAECYELAREEAPELEGRLILNYTIGGEPEVGGVVEEVLINDESDLRHPILDECVRETIYTAELRAPEEGGRVYVTYPIYFAPGEPEAETEDP